jgi:hypothetical protein
VADQSDVKTDAEITPTRDYSVKYVLQKEMKLKAGQKAIVTQIHKNWFGQITHLTVRDPKTGEFFKKVPWNYFRSQ